MSKGRIHFVALERGTEDLSALVLRAPEGPAPSAWDSAFAFASLPLSALPVAPPGLERIHRAWDALSQVRALDADTLANMLVILGETVPSAPPSAIRTPLPRFDDAPPRPRPTAAHPRAYRGTKYKPPRAAQMDAVDLRPHLDDPRHRRALLEAPASGDPRIQEIQQRDRLPFLFSRCLLPLVRAVPAADLERLLAFFRSLRLEERPTLLASVAMLFAEQPDMAFGWLRLLASQAPERQAMIAALVVMAGAHRVDPSGLSPATLEAVFALEPGEVLLSFWLYALFESYSRGVSPRYALAGISAASRVHPMHDFAPIAACDDYDESALAPLFAHVAAVPHWARFPLWFWERCASLEGLATVALSLPISTLEPAIVIGLVDVLMALVYHDLPADRMAAKWSVLREQVASMAAWLCRIEPEYRQKALKLLSAAIWEWDRASELRERLPRVIALADRLCRAPFSKDEQGVEAAIRLLEGDEASASAFLRAPERSYRKLSAACRRRDDEGLIAKGLRALRMVHEAALLRAFCEEPQRLLEAARFLGTLRAPERLRAASRIQAGAEARGFVEAVREAAFDALSRDLPADPADPKVAHALLLLVDGDGNRRALRRFLKAYLGGERDYLLRHPETRAWFARHASLDEELWLRGIALSRDLGDLGAIAITIEQDPLEALKLGTYVGSCLGVGGLCAYSAAAAVLDVNKRVLYARNASGRVVGRQLVALSKEGELVCFEVYPRSASAELKAMFRDYDSAFAEALGVPIHRSTEESEYRIAHILSCEWWDDGASDPFEEPLNPASAEAPP